MNQKLKEKTLESLSAVLPIMAIILAVREKCGMHSEAHGVILSLPVDAVVGI